MLPPNKVIKEYRVTEKATELAANHNQHIFEIYSGVNRIDVARAVERVGELCWHDRAAGEQIARPEMFGDVVLARKETPTSYHLSVVVDDALQGITLVTRGTDLFSSTHVHRLLQALLDLPTPEYWHHPLVLEEDGTKMAKRDGSESIRSYRESGGSVESLISTFDSLPDPG